MKKNETVCAVVVTFNRKNLLIECLEALQKQTHPLDAIFLIDNASTDGTPITLLDNKYINELVPEKLLQPWEKEFNIKNLVNGENVKLHYVRMHENTGGAGGFYEGVKRGYEKGYDWLWLMDDDAEPKEDALEKLLINSDMNVLCVVPLIINKASGKVQNYHHKMLNTFMKDIPVLKSVNNVDYKNKILSIQANAFVGPLIKKRAVDLVGFPNAKLFIWGDDTDYTYRIYKKGKIILVGSAIIYHKDKITENNKLLKEQLWKYYYFFRNKVIFILSYAKFNLLAYFYYFYSAIRMSIIILIKNKQKDKYLLPIKGFVDGFIKTENR